MSSSFANVQFAPNVYAAPMATGATEHTAVVFGGHGVFAVDAILPEFTYAASRPDVIRNGFRLKKVNPINGSILAEAFDEGKSVVRRFFMKNIRPVMIGAEALSDV